MSSTLLAITLSLALGQVPYGGGYGGNSGNGGNGGCSTCNAGGGGGGGSYTGGGGGYAGQDYGGGMSSGGGYPLGGVQGAQYGAEQLYPYDAYENWTQGYFQEMPSYGGYNLYRPYNYKHVLSQSQISGGWGMSPTHPYSHEYFRRLREQAALDQRRSQLDAAYATELARLRVQRDYQQTSAELPQRGPANPSAQRPIDNAAYTQNPQNRDLRREDLQERIRQQALQLQALQEEYYRGASAPAAAIPNSQGPR